MDGDALVDGWAILLCKARSQWDVKVTELGDEDENSWRLSDLRGWWLLRRVSDLLMHHP